MVKMSEVIDENNHGLTFEIKNDKLIKRFDSKFEDFCREFFGGNGVQYDAVFKRSLLIGQSAKIADFSTNEIACM